MPYIIEQNSGNPIIIQDDALNKEFSINLIGRNYEDYGREIAQNTLSLLENFSSVNPPIRPTDGQTWWDSRNGNFRVFDGTINAWVPTLTLVSNAVPPNDYGQSQKSGIMYYNTDSDQLFINVNNEWRTTYSLRDISSSYAGNPTLGFPSTYGSTFRTIFLQDLNGGTPRAVLALTYNNDGAQTPGYYYQGEKILAILSGHNEFTVAANDSSETNDQVVSYYAELIENGGIGAVIKPGLNLRTDNESSVFYADRSGQAAVSFGINTGNVDLAANVSNTITATDIFNANSSLVPNTTDVYDIGQANAVFNEGYITDLYIGNDTSGSILVNGNSVVNIGTANSSVSQIFVNDIVIGGNISVGASTGIGSNVAPIENIFAENFTANVLTIDGYTMPTTSGTTGQQMFIDASNQVFWEDPASSISSVLGGLGLTATLTPTVGTGPGNEIDQNIVTLAVGAGTGIIANANDIAVDLGAFDTDDLPEGAINRYYSDTLARTALAGSEGVTYTPGTGVFGTDETYIRGLFSAGTNMAYNASTGEIINTYTSPFDGLSPANFVTTNTAQTITGQKTLTAPMVATGGITMNNADFAYLGTLSFIGPSGTVQFTTTGGIIADNDITAFSDRRLKSNLEPIAGALDKVDSLTGYTYKRIDTGNHQTGLIAQDVEAVLPEAVVENDEGIKAVAYGNMMGLMVEAIKELRQEVEDLRTELGRK